MRPVLPNTPLLFTDYFQLGLATEDVANHFGYTFASHALTLPRIAASMPWFADLRQRLTQSLPFVSLTSEAARREFLIAPILIDLARYVQVKVRIEYPLKVSEQLQGTLDYYLYAQQQLLVIEAKNAEDLNLYRVPADLDDLLRILIAVLTPDTLQDKAMSP